MKLKWLGYAGGAVAALLGFAFALAWLLVDAEEVTRAVSERLSRAFQQPVAIDDFELALFPVPAIRIHDLRIGAREGADPFVTAASGEIGISLPALFAGQIVLRTLELDGARVALELGPDGLPRWPEVSPIPVATRSDEDGPLLLITSVSVRDGSVVLGPWQIDQFVLEGGGNLDLSADFEFSGRIPGIGALRNGRVDLSNLIDGPVRWDASVELTGLDLGELRTRIAREKALYGNATVTLRASGAGPSLASAETQVALRPLDFQTGGVRVSGDVDIEARTGAEWRADLTGAEIGIAGLLTKPIGSTARVSGRTPEATDLQRRPSEDRPLQDRWLDGLRVELERARLEASVALDDPESAPSLSLSGDLDLAELAEWWEVPGVPTRGRVRLERLRYAPGSTLAAEGAVSDVEVEVPIASKPRKLLVNGPVFASDAVVGARDVSVGFADQSITLSVAYDLRREIGELVVDAGGVDLEPIARELMGDVVIKARLYGRVELSGPLELAAIKGRGRFELPGGEIAGISLERFLTKSSARGDLDAFTRLAGVFEVADGYAKFSQIDLEQGQGVAMTEGTIALATGITDLRGRARLFTPAQTFERFVRVEGTLTALRADTSIVSADDAEESRRMEKRMLEGFLNAMNARGKPGSPEEAKMFQTQREQLERQLKLYEDVESEPIREDGEAPTDPGELGDTLESPADVGSGLP